LPIEIKFLNVLFGVESEYKIGFFLTITVFAPEGETNILHFTEKNNNKKLIKSKSIKTSFVIS
jgi:hypothetical protein